MSDAIISAIITGVITLAGVLIANGKVIAVIQTKLETLTSEVNENKTQVAKIPVIEEKIKVANKRIDDLEKKVG